MMDTRSQENKEPNLNPEDLLNDLGEQVLLAVFVERVVRDDYDKALSLSTINLAFRKLFQDAILTSRLLQLVINVHHVRQDEMANLAIIEQMVATYPHLLFRHATALNEDGTEVRTSPFKFILATGDLCLLEYCLEIADNHNLLDQFVRQCIDEDCIEDLHELKDKYQQYYALVDEPADTPEERRNKVKKLNDFIRHDLGEAMRHLPRWLIDARLKYKTGMKPEEVFDSVVPQEEYLVRDRQKGEIDILQFAKEDTLGQDLALTHNNKGELLVARGMIPVADAEEDCRVWCALFSQGLIKRKELIDAGKKKQQQQRSGGGVG